MFIIVLIGTVLNNYLFIYKIIIYIIYIYITKKSSSDFSDLLIC